MTGGIIQPLRGIAVTRAIRNSDGSLDMETIDGKSTRVVGKYAQRAWEHIGGKVEQNEPGAAVNVGSHEPPPHPIVP